MTWPHFFQSFRQTSYFTEALNFVWGNPMAGASGNAMASNAMFMAASPICYLGPNDKNNF